MEHDETGCQSHPEGPILCANNCGFFGSAATMNLCSKCHKDLVLSQQQAELAASSIKNIVNGTSSGKEPVVTNSTMDVQVQVDVVEPKTTAAAVMVPEEEEEPKEVKKSGPSRCATCNKRVGLTGFKCRCGNLFCGSHRYSDKHECPFDYRSAGQDAIAKANPLVKAEKLDKI